MSVVNSGRKETHQTLVIIDEAESVDDTYFTTPPDAWAERVVVIGSPYPDKRFFHNQEVNQ